MPEKTKKKKTDSGFITVEAALVIPVVLLVILLIYTLGIIQFNNVSTRAEAMRVANRVAMNWNLIGGTGGILKEDAKADSARNAKAAISSDSYEEHDPYRYFVELFPLSGHSKKRQNIIEYLDRCMAALPKSGANLQCETETAITSDAGFHLFRRYVSVSVENTYSNPLNELLAGLGLHVGERYQVTAKAKLTEPGEFVRNISYIEELIRNHTGKKAAGEN